MHFVYGLALAVALLVVAPYVAHRLRRERGEERAFAAARLVPPAPPRARRRARLEDVALFATRAAAVVALAVLGASPFVRCSRLALERSSGASVAMALVIDDSMSMRAVTAQKSRFDRAREGARELLASTRDGDAVAIVLAGAPARVALAATTDLGAARAAADNLVQSDRATDLDGAIAMARSLIGQLPQVDRRVVVLSDLADGRTEAPPLGEGSGLPIWIAMPELRELARDCGILSADRAGLRVRVRFACSHDTTGAGREVAVLEGGVVVAHGALPETQTGELLVGLAPPADAAAAPARPMTGAAREPAAPLIARLTGSDAIESDDSAPVVVEAGPGTIAVVADAAEGAAATGGAPVVEQALSALELDVAVRPIPTTPDRLEDLTPFAGIIVDDPPGFTPEQRRALASFLDGGGVVLLALGPRAAAAPLGASLEPVVGHATAWGATRATGADPSSAGGALSESAASLADLAARDRSTLASEDAASFEPLLKWTDGAPLLALRSLGRGEAWIITLPFSVDVSDLPLRPAFLSILDAWVDVARLRSSPRRTDVGVAWTFPGARSVRVEGPGGRVPVIHDGALARAVPPVLGAYTVTVDDKPEVRVVGPVAREIDLRPRAAAPAAASSALGAGRAALDASPWVAFALLMLVSAEMALRLRARARAAEGEAAR